jgi:hypothetical protein
MLVTHARRRVYVEYAPATGAAGQLREVGSDVLASWGLEVAGMGTENETVRVGSWVEVRDGQLQEFWRIVDPAEADAARRRISVETPLARAVLGHRAGDQVTVHGPGRRWPVEVVAVGD